MSEKLPHTGLERNSLPTAVVTCGDPARAALAASMLEDTAVVAQQREYHTYQGSYQGAPVAICSHGIGAPGAAICFEELIAAGARQIVRVGTCGSLQPGIRPGELVIATAAVQNSGYGRETVPYGYPAVADLDLTQTLTREAAAYGHPYHRGLVLTRDAFFAGVTTPFTPDYATLSQANVLAVEMECAALFLVGSLRRVQMGAILIVNGAVLHTPENMDTFTPHATAVAAAIEAGIRIALRALPRLQPIKPSHEFV